MQYLSNICRILPSQRERCFSYGKSSVIILLNTQLVWKPLANLPHKSVNFRLIYFMQPSQIRWILPETFGNMKISYYFSVGKYHLYAFKDVCLLACLQQNLTSHFIFLGILKERRHGLQACFLVHLFLLVSLLPQTVSPCNRLLNSLNNVF